MTTYPLKKNPSELTEPQFLYALELQDQWRNDQVRLTDREWLTIFPEAIPILLIKIRETKQQRREKVKEIRDKLVSLRLMNLEEAAYDFLRAWIKATDIKELLVLDDRIAKLEWMQSLNQKKTENRIEWEDKVTEARLTPISEILSRYTVLRRSGGRFVAICPLHPDKSPSMTVYPGSNSCWCFACQKGGDPIALVRQIEGLDFRETVNRLTGVQ